MHQRPMDNGVSMAQPQEGLLGQVISAPLASKELGPCILDVSVVRGEQCGKGLMLKMG